VHSGTWLKKNLKGLVIAADGGANLCRRYGIKTSFVIGDFDSVSKATLTYFRKTSKLIHLPAQDSTDFEKALTLAKKLKAKKVYVFGALGGTVDHTIANIISLDDRCVIRDEKHDVYVVHDTLTVEGKRGDVLSVIALSSVSGLSYRNLKWTAPQKTLPPGWSGVRNRFTKSSVMVRVKKGRVAVIKIKT
jgi:thiamine pyrophosphokinase